MLLFPAVLAACSEDDLSSTSVIQPPQVVQNDFDRWLDRHYLAPYNIEFQYRYTDIESSMGYYLTPRRLQPVDRAGQAGASHSALSPMTK